MPERLPVRFVTSPGTTIQFNLTAVGAAVTNNIIQDSAAASITITSYNNAGGGVSDSYIFDELVLMKQGNYIKVISKIINQ